MAILEKDGSLRHTNVASVVHNGGKDSGIMSLKSDSKGLYGVGYSQEGTFEGMFRASWTTGDIDLMADCHGDSYDVLPTNDVIYTASHAHDCSNIGGFSDRSDEGVYHHAVGFSSTATGTVRSNTARGYSDYAGQPAPDSVRRLSLLVLRTVSLQRAESGRVDRRGQQSVPRVRR